MRMTPNHFFWNIIGSVALGFSTLVLISSLDISLGRVVRDLIQTDHVWGVLMEPSITPYGFFFIVMSSTACFIIIRYTTTRGIIGFMQIIIVVAAVFALILGSYLVGSTSTEICWPTCNVLTSHVLTSSIWSLLNYIIPRFSVSNCSLPQGVKTIPRHGCKRRLFIMPFSERGNMSRLLSSPIRLTVSKWEKNSI